MSQSKRSGLTLVELLVVIAIIAVLIAFFVPSTRRVREASARTQIINNLKQMCLALHGYNDFYKRLPPGSGTLPGTTTDTISVGNRMPLSIHLLPYIEQTHLYKKYEAGTGGQPVVIPPYTAPLDFTTTDFIRVQNFASNVRVFTDVGIETPFDTAVTGLDAVTGACTGAIPRTFKDGTSNTIIFATRYANHGVTSQNGEVNCSAYDAPLGADNSAFFGVMIMTGPASNTSSGGWQLAPKLDQANCQFGAVAHSFGLAGIQVGLADASVRTLSPAVSATTWNFLMQPNDGNALLDPNW